MFSVGYNLKVQKILAKPINVAKMRPRRKWAPRSTCMFLYKKKLKFNTLLDRYRAFKFAVRNYCKETGSNLIWINIAIPQANKLKS